MLKVAVFATLLAACAALYPLPTSVESAPFLDLPSAPYPAPVPEVKSIIVPAPVYGPPVESKPYPAAVIPKTAPVTTSYVYTIPKELPPTKPAIVYGPPVESKPYPAAVIPKTAPVTTSYVYTIPKELPPTKPAIVYGPPVEIPHVSVPTKPKTSKYFYEIPKINPAPVYGLPKIGEAPYPAPIPLKPVKTSYSYEIPAVEAPYPAADAPYPAVEVPAPVYGLPTVEIPTKPVVSVYKYEIPIESKPYPAPVPVTTPAPVYGLPEVVIPVKPVKTSYSYEIPPYKPAPYPPAVPKPHSISILIVLLGLSHVNFISARKYHNVIKSKYQFDDLEQIDKDGNIFNVPLVPADEDIPISDLEHGLRVIQVNRQLLDDGHNFDQIHEHFPSKHNGISGRRFKNPKKFQFTYSVPSSEIAEGHKRRGNKEMNDTDFILPKKETEQIFYPEKLNTDVLKNEKEIKNNSNKDVNSQEILFGSRSITNNSSVGSKNEDEKKKETNSNTELNLSVDKLKGNEHIDPLHSILDPHIINNYDLLKHIYHRFLVSPIPYHFSQFGPHRFDTHPNVVNIYYDKRFMQNAPGSHSFIYSTPIEGNLPIPEPVAQVIHVPSQIPDVQSTNLSPPIHVFQPINVSPQIHEPQPINVSPGLQPVNVQQPILSPQPIHLSQEVSQIDETNPQIPLAHLTLLPSFDSITSDKTDTVEELDLKQPEQFQPTNFSPNVEQEIINEYFLPKLEVNTEFKESPIVVPDIVYETSPLLVGDPHVITVLCFYIIYVVNAQRYYPYNYNNYNHIPILRYQYDPNPDGSYTYSYETGNGISAQEQGFVKNLGSVNEAQVKQGGFSYTGPDGVVYSTRYIADENGYRPEGAHLPKQPAIPGEIQRSLAFNSAFPRYDGRYYGK
ncbi:cuticle protein [Holotrichia oblita]|uniref:Cuticle protein n=1 Tax=Holotrichia oblita TaxID=644536 RepID=A0ACB9TG17_HOLOL|nr:cuticle protein [Holotrichia oblita]